MTVQRIGIAVGLLAVLAFLGWGGSVAARRLQALESTVARLDAGMDPLLSRSESVAADLSMTNEELMLAEERVESLSSAVSANTSEVSALEDSLARSQDRLEKLTSDLSELQRSTDSAAATVRSDFQDALDRLSAYEQEAALLGRRVESLEIASDPLPPGTILPWLPTAEGLPEGWSICDGSYGTPDLRGLFLRGAPNVNGAGTYDPGASMLPAGRHAHATEEYRTIHSIGRAVPQSPGNWRVLFDAGVADAEPEPPIDHGDHVHEDEHVPAHFSVVFIIKEE